MSDQLMTPTGDPACRHPAPACFGDQAVPEAPQRRRQARKRVLKARSKVEGAASAARPIRE
jgi:hypothetical protein